MRFDLETMEQTDAELLPPVAKKQRQQHQLSLSNIVVRATTNVTDAGQSSTSRITVATTTAVHGPDVKVTVASKSSSAQSVATSTADSDIPIKLKQSTLKTCLWSAV